MLESGTCQAPCDKWVPAGEYFVGGRGLSSSGKFLLLPGENTSLFVNGGSRGGAIAGTVLWASGGVFFGVGLGLFAGTSGCGSTTTCNKSAENAVDEVGGVMLFGGTILLITGIWIALHNQTTVKKLAGTERTEQAFVDPRLVDTLSGTFRF